MDYIARCAFRGIKPLTIITLSCVSRDLLHAASRGQSNTDPQNLGEKGTREDGRKSIPEVFIPVRLISISGFASASVDPAE